MVRLICSQAPTLLIQTPKNKPYILQVPCKRYLAKFAHSLYGNPIPANSSSFIGIFIEFALTKNRYGNSQECLKHLDGSLQVKLSRWQFDRIGFSVAPEHALAVNSILDDLFCEHLFTWVSRNINPSVRYSGTKDAMLSFAERHGIVIDDIDEDISFEALKKKEYRTRQRMQLKEEQAKKNVAALSLQNPINTKFFTHAI